jgi:hypothetical protein
MKATRFAIAIAFLATGGTAAAQSATDARCILLSNVFAKQSKDANAQKTAEASFYFYLGRIGNQATAAQMKALFDQQSKTITDANAGGLMGECAKGVQAKMQLMQSLAGQAQPAAKPQQPKPTQPQGR